MIAVALLFCSVFSHNAYALSKPSEKPRSSYNLGTAGVLKGRCVAVNLFCNTPGNSWTELEKSERIKQLNKACTFIEKQARTFGNDTEFVYNDSEKGMWAEVRFCSEITSGEDFEKALDGKIKCWSKYLIPYEKLYREYEADSVFIIVHFKELGNCYAISYDGEDIPEEALVIYRDSTEAELAHEILHLYGAHDFYRGAEYSDDVVKYLSGVYPSEIMLRPSWKIENNMISSLTAYHVGWLHDSEDADRYPQLGR